MDMGGSLQGCYQLGDEVGIKVAAWYRIIEAL